MTQQELELPKGWVETEFKKTVKSIPLTGKKLKQKEYLQSGKFPVIDQGQDFIGGFTDKKDLVVECKLPIIVFGDHTKTVKFVNQNFVAGADGGDLDNYVHLWLEKVSNTTSTMLFDEVICVPIGAIAEYDGGSAIDTTWYDKSGNNLDGTVNGATIQNRIDALEVVGVLKTGDIELENERGHWKIIEESEYLSITNVNTNKKYKLLMEEIE